MPRKKETEIVAAQQPEEMVENREAVETQETEQDITDAPVTDEQPDEQSADEPNEQSREEAEKKSRLNLGILKIRVDDDDSPKEDEREIAWNELVNAYRTRRIITVIMSGIEKTQLAGNVVVAYHKGQRILIPVTEMMIYLSDETRYPNTTLEERLDRICNTMLGAEIDVVIKGMDKESGSVVASRQEAMLKKREKFYLTDLSDGLPQVREGRIVEARIIGVTQMTARIEIFGVETTLSASQLSWDWIADVSEKFHVGDQLNVLITGMTGDSVDNLKVTADVKSITPNTSMENLSKCNVQGKYIGEVTNVRNGIVYLRLKVGVNAIAHTNYDKRTPGKGDVVSFVITRINPDYGNVSGIISRIIKQRI